jgi:hypothetical protein
VAQPATVATVSRATRRISIVLRVLRMTHSVQSYAYF